MLGCVRSSPHVLFTRKVDAESVGANSYFVWHAAEGQLDRFAPSRSHRTLHGSMICRVLPITVVVAALLMVGLGCAEPSDSTRTAADTTATAAPSTDIHVASLQVQGSGLRVGPPMNITPRAGYDNQPTFTPDGQALIYTSVRDGQADTYRYTFADSTHRAVTDTPTSEYSPTLHDAGFSVVRVEADGTQRLWQFAADGASPSLLLPDIQPVGYHAWVMPDRVVLYVLGDPATLQLAALDAGTADTLARDIGRSLQVVPGRAATVSFVQHTDSTAHIHLLDAAAGTTEPLVATRPSGDFHAWTPGGLLLMAEGSTLYQHDPSGDDSWQPVADLAPLRDITRLAVSPSGDRLAFVTAEPSAE